MLSTRIATALVLIPLVLAALFALPPAGWAAAALAAIALGAGEWARLSGYGRREGVVFAAVTVAGGALLLVVPAAGFGPHGWPVGVLLALCGPALAFWLVVAPQWLRANARPASRFALAAVGLIVLIGAWAAVVQLQARSPWLVLAALAIVWIADTAAYFTGRAFGRRKLAPAISPGKTWEGVYGALAAVAVYALALVPLAPRAGYSSEVSATATGAWVALALAIAALSIEGRPRRVAAQAPCRCQGQRHAAARARRRTRSHRRAAVVDAGRRAPRSVVPAMTMRRVSLLGATGSIGASTLDVIARHPERFEVVALAANRDADKLAALCRRYRPRLAALRDADAARALEQDLAGTGLPTQVLAGEAGLCAVAAMPEADTVLAAIVGARGPRADARRRACGQAHPAREQGGARDRRGRLHGCGRPTGGATLLPIDSEHNAIFQCLPARMPRDPAAAGVRRILLTASGGPFPLAVACRARARDAGRGVRASELGDGAQDQRRFGDDDEQGARGDRGALAVRRAARGDRGRDPPGERHPFAGRIR